MAILTRIEAFKDLVQEAVDQGATTVEQIHQRIAQLPLSVLQARGLISEAAREQHEQQVSAVYDTLRAVNQQLGDFTSQLIESLENHADVQRRLGERKD